jgi:hypothetical protein
MHLPLGILLTFRNCSREDLRPMLPRGRSMLQKYVDTICCPHIVSMIQFILLLSSSCVGTDRLSELM